MPKVAIPSHLKNVESVSLELMSPEEMLDMSFGEVLTAETINYRTGAPQMNGLFCQAIFGPVKDWECACGKYKRYRYAGIICDKCGVQVTHSTVRRERMGHISLAAPCVHPWFLRIIPSRIALILDMKTIDVTKIAYFSAYVVTEINEDLRQEYLSKIEKDSLGRTKQVKLDFDKRFEDIARQYQKDKSADLYDPENLKIKYESDKEILKIQQAELVSKIETIAQVAYQELTSLKYKDVITEVMYQELAQKFGPVFKAGIGAEAVESLLHSINLADLFEDLKTKLAVAKGQNKKKLSKRFKLVKNFLNHDTRPEWMVLKRIMVLPPDLRPMLQLDGGRFAASDLNELYRRLINRNNRLRKLIQIGAPEVILRNEKRMLQESVEALIDNSARNGKQVMASTGARRPLKSLTDVLKGKQGRFRQNLLGKRVDYSGRSVIIVGPSLKLDQCGLPKDMALELFKPFLMSHAISKSEKGLLTDEFQVFNVHSARRLVESRHPIVYDMLDEVIADKCVLLNRAPTLHRLSFIAFKPVLVEGKGIKLHPLVCKAFNADFDGDQMAVHLPITIKAQEEAMNLMLATKNLLKPASGDLIMEGNQDLHLGVYYMTFAELEGIDPKTTPAFCSSHEAILAFKNSHLTISQPIQVKGAKGSKTRILTTVGRVIFNNCLPSTYPFKNETISKKNYSILLNNLYHSEGSDQTALTLDIIKDVLFKYATESGISASCDDLRIPAGKQDVLVQAREKVSFIQNSFEQNGLMTEIERYRQVVNVWRAASETISKMTESQMTNESNIDVIIRSGARGNVSQLNLMVGIRGLSVDASGRIIELPAQHGYLEGLNGLEYFISMKGQRKGQADLVLKTADAGYLTRRLVDVAQNVIVMAQDCETTQSVVITKANSAKISRSIWDRIYGRYLASDIVVDGKTVANRNDLVDFALLALLKNYDLDNIFVRTSTKCVLSRGICVKCYGIDFSNHKPVKEGSTVGIIAAQSLGEPSTQLTISSKHSFGVVTKSDITNGLPRVEEIFEGRIPKYTSPIVNNNGIIKSIEGSVDNGFTVTIESSGIVTRLPYNQAQSTMLVSDGQEVTDKELLVMTSAGEVTQSFTQGVVHAADNMITITASQPIIQDYQVIPGIQLNFRVNDSVLRGQSLAEAPLDMQSVLDMVGLDELQEYIIQDLIGIYNSNGIVVNEKHIEVIIRQMCGRVQVVEPGDSDLIAGDQLSLNGVIAQNKTLRESGSKEILFKRVITGISKASLSTESFLSAASFQETSRVLVEAVTSKAKDYLLGLKENVILGQLIPAGTGYTSSISTKLAAPLEEFTE
jgi:DNA-directed RNA polymerase subunit beta'